MTDGIENHAVFNSFCAQSFSLLPVKEAAKSWHAQKRARKLILLLSGNHKILETKLVALWTKSFLSLACCSLVPILKQSVEWSRILTAVMTIDTEFVVYVVTYPMFFVTHPTFFPIYTVWNWNPGRLPGNTNMWFSTHDITTDAEKEETCSCWRIHSGLVVQWAAAVPAPGWALVVRAP